MKAADADRRAIAAAAAMAEIRPGSGAPNVTRRDPANRLFTFLAGPPVARLADDED